MILGIGVDIVDIERIKQKVNSGSGFKEYVFSKVEIQSCEKKSNPYESFAARFAAKEAFLKALGTGIDLTFELNHLEIYNDEIGKPYFVFSKLIEEHLFAVLACIPIVHLSISHSKEQAIAFVVLNKN